MYTTGSMEEVIYLPVGWMPYGSFMFVINVLRPQATSHALRRPTVSVVVAYLTI